MHLIFSLAVRHVYDPVDATYYIITTTLPCRDIKHQQQLLLNQRHSQESMIQEHRPPKIRTKQYHVVSAFFI